MRVLILEYDAVQCDLIFLVLRRNGFEPSICEDPHFIREEIKTKQPEALIIDTHLPNQNGIDLLRELEDENVLKNIYVIVLSALGFTCIVRQSVEAGADDFLIKPLDMDALINRLKFHETVDK